MSHCCAALFWRSLCCSTHQEPITNNKNEWNLMLHVNTICNYVITTYAVSDTCKHEKYDPKFLSVSWSHLLSVWVSLSPRTTAVYFSSSERSSFSRATRALYVALASISSASWAARASLLRNSSELSRSKGTLGNKLRSDKGSRVCGGTMEGVMSGLHLIHMKLH